MTEVKTHQSQSGLTLVELMVVIAILGVAATTATVIGRTEQTIESVAQQIAGSASAAARRGVSGGPVTLSPQEFRSRLVIDNTNARGLVSVEVLITGSGTDADSDGTDDLYDTNQTGGVDADADGISDEAWVESSRHWMPSDVELFAVDMGVANTVGGATPTGTLGAGFQYIGCRAGGGCESATIYLQTTRGALRQYRIVLLELSSLPLALPGW